MPGPFGETGLSGASSDLKGWSTLNTLEALQSVLGAEVFVQNDANAAAMAERLGGHAQALHSYAYLYFGAGLGLGIVSNGQLLSGAFGNAGELGQIVVATPDGPRPLEQIASRNAARAHLAAAGLDGSDMDQLHHLFSHERAIFEGWIDRAADGLTQIIPMLENLLDPETVLMGGAMPAPVLSALVERVALPEKSVSNRRDRTCPRLQVGTCGRLTATRGAAALVLSHALHPQLALSA
jgi:predicted NBD/HSP70 family sugar kinase